MSLTLTEREKSYLADICEAWITEYPEAAQDAPALYALATKIIDWAEAE